MRVAWLNESPMTKDAAGRLVGVLASVRYRCIIPQAQLKGRGVESFLLGRIDKADPAAFSQVLDKMRPDVAVIGKVFNSHVLDLVSLLKKRGVKVAIDFCDNHFNRPPTGDLHRALIAAADAVVASTPMMAEAITRETGSSSTLIPDPYEGPGGAPRFAPAPGGPLKLLWFGGRTNLDTLAPCFPSLDALGKTMPLSLTIFTDPMPQIEQLLNLAKAQFPGIAKVVFQPWSLEGQWRAIDACDAVIIPSLDNETKSVKGPNRLIEAIHGGRPVVAYPLPSYLEFRDVCWLDRDIGAGLRALLADPAAVAPRVAAGKVLVEERYAPKTIAERWLALLNRITATIGAEPADATINHPG
jgi:glycosyltransferase involved in cell wall biosynthesis